MIPSAFVTMDTLPMTPNGKIDRNALPIPQTTRPELAGAFVPLNGPIEEILAEIWQEVLHLDQIGRHDNFFQLGGHSLSAVKVISRLQQVYDIDLTLRTLFELPTIAQLIPLVEEILLDESDDDSLTDLAEE
jgi:acyl carrier protein